MAGIAILPISPHSSCFNADLRIFSVMWNRAVHIFFSQQNLSAGG